jgi:hypothetical protein
MRLSAADAAKLGLAMPPKGKVSAKPASLFPALCLAHGLPEPVAELRFAPPRRWRFDWSWEPCRLALEIDGGAWTGGRHTRGKGFIADQEKRNAAVLLGWRVLHCTPQDVKTGAVFGLLKQAMERKAG